MKGLIKKYYLNLRKILLYTFYYLFYIKKLFKVKQKTKITKILFIRIDRIGDLVLSTPAIKALKISFPNSQLIVLASNENYAVLKNNPYVDDTIVYNTQECVLKKIEIIKLLRKFRFDLAIDPYPGYKLITAVISLLSGANERIGFSEYGREVFFNKYISKSDTTKHFVNLTLDVLKPLGIQIWDKCPRIYISEKEIKLSKKWFEKKIFGNRPIIGIHPGSYYNSQRWLTKNYAELINKLLENNANDIIIFGGSRDVELIKKITSKVRKKTIIFTSLNLRKFICLLYYCDILICNNSGPLHIAVATNTPTVSFMGPTLKDRWMPLGSIHKVLRIDNLPCIGCRSGHCRIKTHDCMKFISPSMVLEQISLMKKIVSNSVVSVKPCAMNTEPLLNFPKCLYTKK